MSKYKITYREGLLRGKVIIFDDERDGHVFNKSTLTSIEKQDLRKRRKFPVYFFFEDQNNVLHERIVGKGRFIAESDGYSFEAQLLASDEVGKELIDSLTQVVKKNPFEFSVMTDRKRALLGPDKKTLLAFPVLAVLLFQTERLHD